MASYILFYEGSSESRQAVEELREMSSSQEWLEYVDVTDLDIEFSGEAVLPWLVTPEGEFSGLEQIRRFVQIRPEARLQELSALSQGS